MLTEKIEVDIIYYEKQKDGLKIIIPVKLEKQEVIKMKLRATHRFRSDPSAIFKRIFI